MSAYERFDTEQNGSAVSVELSVPESESATAGGQASNIEDVQIKVDKQIEAEKDGHLTIYTEENKSGIEYIDDPSKDIPKDALGLLQYRVKTVIEHVVFRCITVLLIILDFTLVTIDLTKSDCSSNMNALEIISHLIISYFLLEVGARIFYQGQDFFCNIFEVIDGAIVVISFIVDMVFIGIAASTSCDSAAKYSKLVVIGRVVRIIRIGRIIYLMVQQRRHIATASRRVVSQNKRRYQKDGFDLDLCYITERVIAMSFPSVGLMSMYRNPIREVARFFDTKHKGHYKIYNLCSERDYDETLFHNMVERVYIDDHNVPRVRDMIDFTANVREWMQKDKQNIIAIHCKGGKGRTGTMICVWLVDCGIFEQAEESLEYFGDRRTDLTVGKRFQGVETPSQSRYVGYYEKVLKEFGGGLPPRREKKIVSVKIEGLTGVGNGDGSDLGMEIRADGLLIYECRFGTNVNCQVMRYTDSDSIVVELKNQPAIADDIKIRFLSTAKNIPKVYDHCAFFFWFHTSFIEDNILHLSRDEIDNPHKKKAQKVFRDCFTVELKFEDVQNE